MNWQTSLLELQKHFKEELTTSGVRRTWSCLSTDRPKTKVLPIKPAVLFTPLQEIPNLSVIQNPPIRCSKCGAINSQFNFYDKASRVLTCSLCGTKVLISNTYPLNQSGYPHEMCIGTTESVSAVEYINPSSPMSKRRLMFVFDIGSSEKEIEYLRDEFLSSIAVLPEETDIGIITVGATVNIHDIMADKTYVIGTDILNSSGSFKGNGDNIVSSVDDMLGRLLGFDYKTRLVRPLSTTLVNLNETVQQVLVQDPWANQESLQPGLRPYRLLGLAMAVASRILMDGELVIFSSGPVTVGPGITVVPDMKTQIRGWDDINSHTHGSEASLARQSTNYYNFLIPIFSSMKSDLPTQIANIDLFSPSVGINVFIAAKEQTGLLEMRGLIEGTGGEVFLCESFSDTAFSESLRLLMESSKGMGKKGLMEISTSKGISITNVIGHGIPLHPSTTTDLTPIKKTTATNSVGGSVGSSTKASNRWGIALFDKRTTIEIDLDMKQNKKNKKQGTSSKPGETENDTTRTNFYQAAGHNLAIMQIRFYYSEIEGQQRVRVVTFPFKLLPDVDINMFDQEAAIVSLARQAMYNADCGMMPQDIITSIDTSIIRMCREFSRYEQNNPASLTLPVSMQLLPLFSFHLRRAAYITLRDTPDITALQRFRLLKSGVIDGVRIIQPPLFVYTATNPTLVPAPLDSSSAKHDCVMLLDATDRVVVWYGKTVAAWRDDGWCDKEGYENIKTLVNKPIEDAKRIQASRYPSPRLTICDEGTSQARFVLSRVNPSGDGVAVKTSDISFAKFIESLRQIVVKPPE